MTAWLSTCLPACLCLPACQPDATVVFISTPFMCSFFFFCLPYRKKKKRYEPGDRYAPHGTT